MTVPTAAPADPPDEALVAAARKGDLFAWELLIRRYQESVFRMAYLVVRDSELASGASRSTFVRAFRVLPTYEGEPRLLPWLFRIGVSEARAQRRESGRPRATSRPIEKQQGPQLPAGVVPGLVLADGLTPLEREAISEAFDRLDEEDRLTIASRYLFGLSKEDTSAALSLAAGAIDEQLTTAVRRLRSRLTAA